MGECDVISLTGGVVEECDEISLIARVVECDVV